MNEIAIILGIYAKDKSTPGRLIQVIAFGGEKWQACPLSMGRSIRLCSYRN
jgi:hypothetical protein